MPRLKVLTRVRGSVIRPPYDGYVSVYVPSKYDKQEVMMAVFRRLQATSFPEILYADIFVTNWQEV